MSTRTRDDNDEHERRLLRLLGYLAYAVEESEHLGYLKTSIEIRRACLQLCFEAGADPQLIAAFQEGVEKIA